MGQPGSRGPDGAPGQAGFPGPIGRDGQPGFAGSIGRQGIMPNVFEASLVLTENLAK